MKLSDTIEVKSGLYVTKIVQMNGNPVEVMIPNPNLTDEERLTRDPYIEMVEEASKKEKFTKTVMTQEFVNDYLKAKGLETITERRAKNNKRDILGILTSDYQTELQKIVFEYAQNNGIDLFESQERKNPVLGVMSKKERVVADILVKDYIDKRNNSLVNENQSGIKM